MGEYDSYVVWKEKGSINANNPYLDIDKPVNERGKWLVEKFKEYIKNGEADKICWWFTEVLNPYAGKDNNRRSLRKRQNYEIDREDAEYIFKIAEEYFEPKCTSFSYLEFLINFFDRHKYISSFPASKIILLLRNLYDLQLEENDPEYLQRKNLTNQLLKKDTLFLRKFEFCQTVNVESFWKHYILKNLVMNFVSVHDIWDILSMFAKSKEGREFVIKHASELCDHYLEANVNTIQCLFVDNLDNLYDGLEEVGNGLFVTYSAKFRNDVIQRIMSKPIRAGGRTRFLKSVLPDMLCDVTIDWNDKQLLMATLHGLLFYSRLNCWKDSNKIYGTIINNMRNSIKKYESNPHLYFVPDITLDTQIKTKSGSLLIGNSQTLINYSEKFKQILVKKPYIIHFNRISLLAASRFLTGIKRKEHYFDDLNLKQILQHMALSFMAPNPKLPIEAYEAPLINLITDKSVEMIFKIGCKFQLKRVLIETIPFFIMR